MQIRTLVIFLVTLIAFVGCASHTPIRSDSVLELPDIQSEHYKAVPYIQAAIALQSLDRPAVLERLHAMAQDRDSDDKVIILCRMLFTQRSGMDFRRPRIGGAWFLDGTDYPDWPLEPVELVDGVPFLITRGYILGGKPELGETYLRYCETNCDWSSFRYTSKTEQQKQDALRHLVASPKWKKPLDAYELGFLTEQIQ